jgi:hypothetical protein
MYDSGESKARTLGRKPSDKAVDSYFRDYMDTQIKKIAPDAEVLKWKNPDGTTTYVVKKESAFGGKKPTIAGRMVGGTFVSGPSLRSGGHDDKLKTSMNSLRNTAMELSVQELQGLAGAEKSAYDKEIEDMEGWGFDMGRGLVTGGPVGAFKAAVDPVRLGKASVIIMQSPHMFGARGGLGALVENPYTVQQKRLAEKQRAEKAAQDVATLLTLTFSFAIFAALGGIARKRR